MKLYCLSISLDNLSEDHILAKIQHFLRDQRQHYIVTPNPEMVVLAKKDKAFRQAILSADLSLIDGFGLTLALRFLSHEKIYRVPGTDVLIKLFQQQAKLTRFIFGAENGVAAEAATQVTRQYQTTIVGEYEPKRGVYDTTNALQVLDTEEHNTIIQKINDTGPDILVVALGHNLQEKWMHSFLKEVPSVKVAIGVGGALDYISGRISRPPRIVRTVGLEWLWRLLREPSRWRRIFTAVALFPLEVAKVFFRRRFYYRPSVVGCVLNSQREILLVSRTDDPNHWQLPQGGRESGESNAEAIIREMREELGTDKLKIIGQSRPDIYRYSWPKQQRVQIAVADSAPQRNYTYRGQRQTVFFLQFTGNDSDLKLDGHEHEKWQWVSQKDFLLELNPVRRRLGALILKQLHDFN